jgi:hypothetical protein
MNRLVRGSVILAAAAVSWACGGLDTDGDDTTAQLVADPGVVYVANTDSQAVFVEALNDLGQQLEGNFTVTNVGAGINVNYDTTFAPRPGVDNLPTRVRYFVRAIDPTSFVNTSFTVTANGKTLTIPVRITPSNLAIDLSNATPALGELVTLTAPANLRFTPASAVTVGGGVGVVTGLSADSTQITLLFGPNITLSAVTVSNVVVSYLPGQTFALPTTGTVTTPQIAAIAGTFSNAAPAVGDTVDFVLDPQYRALGSPTITFGASAARIAAISADSQTIRFLPQPGSTGSPAITGVALAVVLPVPLSLPAAASLTVANSTVYTGTDDPTTAPTFNLSNLAVGDTLDFFDLSTNIDQFYKIVTTGSVTVAARLTWPAGPDMDILWCNAACSAFVGNFAGATSANPENSTVTFAAGTNHFWANLYAGAAPAWIRIRFIRTA